MCYPYPGPRCSSHARTDLVSAIKHLEKTLSESPDNHDAYGRARKRYEDANNAWLRTPDGIKMLRKEGHPELADEYAVERREKIALLKDSENQSGECADQERADSEIAELAVSSPDKVTSEMARQYNLSTQTLWHMAKECPQVQREVAANPNASGEALKVIAARASHYQSSRHLEPETAPAYGQPSSVYEPDDAGISDEEHATLRSVAGHPNADESTLFYLGNSNHSDIRAAVARHPRTPRNRRRLLLSDPDEHVRADAITASSHFL